jgi:hypothetical protein
MNDRVYWWNNTDKGKAKYSEKSVSQCHLVYHKSHMDRLVTETAPPE